MRNVVRVLVALVGLLNLVLGGGFLFDTVKSGKDFFLTADSIQGIATMRADMTSFFLVAALFALYGAWKGKASPLLVPAALFGIALSGRFISLAIDGASPTAAMPMIAEAIMIAILLFGYRTFGKNTGASA